MAAALKASAKPFRNDAACVRSVSASQCWHQAQLRTPWLQLLRDGDLIPCSMTQCLAGNLAEDRPFLALNWCPHSYLWCLVPWVGGLGTNFFSGVASGQKCHGQFLLGGVAAVLKAPSSSSSSVVPHARAVSAPDGVGIRPGSGRRGSGCIETVT